VHGGGGDGAIQRFLNKELDGIEGITHSLVNGIATQHAHQGKNYDQAYYSDAFVASRTIVGSGKGD
jgi:hypothetical protein